MHRFTTRFAGALRKGQGRGRRGGSSPPAPTWTQQPAPSFTQGASSSYNISNLVSNETSITLVGTLPTGISFDGTSLNATTGHLAGSYGPFYFNATNGSGTTPSDNFNVVVASPQPVWTQAPSYSLTEGTPLSAQAVPVSASGAAITVAWVSGTISGQNVTTRPNWITFSAASATPTVSFSGHVDANDVTNMIWSATVSGGTPVNSPSSPSAGSITVSVGDVTWTTVPTPISFTQGTGVQTHDLKNYVSNWNGSLYTMSQTAGSKSLPTIGVTLSADGVLSYNGTNPVDSSTGVQVTISDTATADWLSRSSASGVFFKENFNYASLVAAADHANNPKYYGASAGTSSNPDPNTYELITTNALSGKTLRIHRRALSGQSTNTWLYTWDNNNGPQVPFTPASTKDNYYFQFIVAGDTFFNWPWLLSGSQTGGSGEFSSPKLLQLGRADGSTISGELVITNDHCQGFVTAYIRGEPFRSNPNATTLFTKSRNTTQRTPDYAKQPSIDAGTPANPTTMQEYRQRYGVFWSDEMGGADYPVIDGSTRLSNNANYVARLNDAATAGIPWYRTQRTVVTVHKTTSSVRIWAGPYGQPQKLIVDTLALGWDLSWLGTLTDPSVNIGTGFQLSNYVTGNINAGGAEQPDTWVDYIELIGSTNPINAPGGFALPGV